MKSVIEILRFAGWVALGLGLCMAGSVFLQNVGSKPLLEVLAESTLVWAMIAFLCLTAGSVFHQRLNALFSARDAIVAGTLLALPPVLGVMAWIATSSNPNAQTFVFGTIVFWLTFSFFAFVVIYLFPRIIGPGPFGQ